MKRLFVIMVILTIFTGCNITMNDPKTAVCLEGCKAAIKDCVRKAEGDRAKKIACEVVKDKCIENCNLYYFQF